MSYENIAIIISVISLFLSILTLYKQRKRVTVTFQKDMIILNAQKDILCNAEPFPTACKMAFLSSIEIVNPSNNNSAFFDLRAFNPLTNENHFIATQRTSLPNIKDNPIFIKASADNNLSFFITLPKRTFGELPAGSYTSIDVLIMVNDKVSLKEGIMLSFKISNTSWFNRSPFSDTNRKIYEAHHCLYNVKNIKELLLQRTKQSV